MRNLKLYNIDSEFDFGKYKGKVLSDIVFKEVTYFKWCIVNVKWFVLEDKSLEQILIKCKNLFLNQDTSDFESSIDYHKRINNEKLDLLNKSEADYNDQDRYNERHSYNGNWLADAAGTDDPEVMNDVYWNLD